MPETSRNLVSPWYPPLREVNGPLQPTTNVSKSNSADKQDTGNPSSHTHRLERKCSKHKVLSLDSICRSVGNAREGVDVGRMGRRYQVWVDRQQQSSASQGNSGGEDETGTGAVKEVPDGWVGESEGQAELEGGLPGETTL